MIQAKNEEASKWLAGRVHALHPVGEFDPLQGVLRVNGRGAYRVGQDLWTIIPGELELELDKNRSNEPDIVKHWKEFFIKGKLVVLKFVVDKKNVKELFLQGLVVESPWEDSLQTLNEEGDMKVVIEEPIGVGVKRKHVKSERRIDELVIKSFRGENQVKGEIVGSGNISSTITRIFEDIKNNIKNIKNSHNWKHVSFWVDLASKFVTLIRGIFN